MAVTPCVAKTTAVDDRISFVVNVKVIIFPTPAKPTTGALALIDTALN